MNTFKDGEWSNGTPSNGEKVLYIGSDGGKIETFYSEPKAPTPIRIITTGAMQRRFTIPEEVFIASDATASVIKSRLLNSEYCDLDFQDTIDGVNYICGVMLSAGIIQDSEARSAELLADGNESDKY